MSDSVTARTGAELQPGHTVAVVVESVDDGWRAIDIRQSTPLVGPVEDIADNVLMVLGTRVAVEAPVSDIKKGDWIAVSGLWRGDVVIASKVESIDAATALAQVSGTFMGRDESRRVAIGTTVLEGIDPQHLEPGDFVRAAGIPSRDGLQVETLEKGIFDLPVGIVEVEGFYSAPQPSGLYTVLGSGLVAFTDRPEMISTEVRVVRCGSEGRLVGPFADRGEADPAQITGAKLGCEF